MTTVPTRRGEIRQQVELLGGEVDRPAGQGHPAGPRVHDEVGDRDRRARGVGGTGRPPQDGADARLELAGLEGLEHVVVGTGVQRLHHAVVVVPRGRHDDRHRRDRAQHAQQLPAVEVRQAEVQDDEVRAVLDGLPQAGQGRARRAHRVAPLAQGADEGGADPLVVLDHQELGHGATVMPARAPPGDPHRALTRPWGRLNPRGGTLCPMNRSVALGAAWSASAIAAVGLGFLAVSLVDASASPGTAPVAATTTASTTPGAPSGTTPIPAGHRRVRHRRRHRLRRLHQRVARSGRGTRRRLVGRRLEQARRDRVRDRHPEARGARLLREREPAVLGRGSPLRRQRTRARARRRRRLVVLVVLVIAGVELVGRGHLRQRRLRRGRLVRPRPWSRRRRLGLRRLLRPQRRRARLRRLTLQGSRARRGTDRAGPGRLPPCSCGCPLSLCAPSATTRPTPRSPATGCSFAAVTSGGPRPAGSPGCRWASASSATSSASSARRWTRWARRRCTSPRCCPASPTRRPTGGPSTAPTCSG